jgi:CRP/FNR family transcriptional regulator, cyclic AMP receptor protein
MANLLPYLGNAKDTKTFSAGETVIHVGSLDRNMYVVLTGEIDLFLDGVCVETIKHGEIVGEHALIYYRPDPPLTAAIAKTDVLVAIVNETKFRFLMHEAPMFAFEMMRILGDRIHRFHTTRH